jgi:aldehyde dehydrogenase (NAD+)
MDERRQLLIGGEWVDPEATSSIDVIGASTEEVIGRVPDAVPADIDRAVAAARLAFDTGEWPRLSPSERASYLNSLSQALQSRESDITSTITAENGSPISLCSMLQLLPTTMTLDYYAELARNIEIEETRQGMLGGVVVRREPVGSSPPSCSGTCLSTPLR